MNNFCPVLQMHADNEGALKSAARVELLPTMGLQRVCIQPNFVNNSLLNGPDASNETTFQLNGYYS